MPVWCAKVMDLTEDGFFSLMNEDGDIREDLKLTENCNPNTPEAVREMMKAAEEANERILVCLLYSSHYLCNALLVQYWLWWRTARFSSYFLPRDAMHPRY